MSNKSVEAFAAEAPGSARQFARFPAHVYVSLEKQCPKPALTPGVNDPIYAAYLLGMQHVLRLVREGFVV